MRSFFICRTQKIEATHSSPRTPAFYFSKKSTPPPPSSVKSSTNLRGRKSKMNVSMMMSVLHGPLGSLVVTRVPARGLSRQPNDRDGQTGPTHFRGRRSKMGYRFLDLQDRISKIEDGGGSSIFDSEGRRWGRSPSIFGAGRSENPPPSIFEAGRAKNSPIFDLRPSIFDPEDRRTLSPSSFFDPEDRKNPSTIFVAGDWIEDGGAAEQDETPTDRFAPGDHRLSCPPDHRKQLS